MLTNIDNKLDGIQVSLNNLVNLIKDESVRDRVRKRNEVYNAMISTVRPLINTLRKYAEDGDTLKITKSIIAWGESTICGNPDYISPNTYAAMILGDNNDNMFSIYDRYVFSSTDFDLQSYEPRLAYRLADIEMFNLLARLKILYLCAVSHDIPTVIEAEVDALSKFAEDIRKLNQNTKVEINDSFAVCHLDGARLVLEKNLIHYNEVNYNFVGENYPNDQTNPWLYNKMRAKNETWEKCRECTMSMKEAQTILKFYGYNKSMRDILIEGGCEIRNGANGCFITNDGTIATFRSETPLAGYRRTIYDLKAVNIPLSTTLSENDRGNMDRTSNIATFVRMIINGQYRYEVNRMPGSPDLYRAVIIRRN